MDRLFLWFLRGFMDFYSQSEIITSLESHTASQNMCIMTMCSDLTEL